jgi:hypothetical protein
VVLFEHNFQPLIGPNSPKMQKKRIKTC